MSITYLNNSSNIADIHAYLIKCHDLFTPQLSEEVNIEKYSEKIFNYATRFEAWKDKELVGLVASYFSEGKEGGFITSVSVDRNFWGQKIAKALIGRCINYGREEKFKSISLEVHTQSIQAINLYFKYEFKIAKINDDKYYMTHIL